MAVDDRCAILALPGEKGEYACMPMSVRACVRVCVHACECACMRASVRACVRVRVHACERLSTHRVEGVLLGQQQIRPARGH